MNRGIDTLLCLSKNKERILRRNKKPITDWSNPVWVSNISIDKATSEEKIRDIHNTFMSNENRKRIITIPIKLFVSNGNIVNVNNMYKEETNLSISFFRTKNALRLIVIPAKTKEEILAVGQDSDGKYRFPLILSVKNNRYKSINL